MPEDSHVPERSGMDPETAVPLAEHTKSWRQADVFDLPWNVIVDETGIAVREDAPHGVAVVSQSCDAYQPTRPYVQIAPVVQLKADAAMEARNGRRPSYAHLVCLGEHWFADLHRIVTVDKHLLIGVPRRPGVVTDKDILRFGATIGRKFSRFPFPDEVAESLKPLQDALRSKVLKPQSPLGQLVDTYIHTIHVESDSRWLGPPYAVNLVLVVKADSVPFSDRNDSLPDEPSDLKQQLRGAQPGQLASQASFLAERLLADPLLHAMTPELRYWTWQYLALSFTELCEKEAKSRGYAGKVVFSAPDIVSVDDFPLSRFEKSASLDLDHLSIDQAGTQST